MSTGLLRALAAAALAAVAQAHPGGRDASGCHVERASGKRHCHGKGPAGRAAGAEKEKASGGSSDRTPPAAVPLRRVLRAVDGDTVELDGGERVRLIGVDTPETKDARTEVRFLAKRAAVFLDDLVAGATVRLEYEGAKPTRDRYGRTLAYLYLADGRCVNGEIVRQGHGFAYTRFPFRHLDRFRGFEREARAAQRGLWAPDAAGERARRRLLASEKR